jgi:DNA-binding CsgD family transcriptional regulator
LKQHADFRIAQGVAAGFKEKYRHSDYDDLVQRANVVLLDEKEDNPVGHKNRPLSIKKAISGRLSTQCIKESRRRQIFQQPPEDPEDDESESSIDWTDIAAARWSPRRERASRIKEVLRTRELNRKEWRIWKLLAQGKTHVEIARALGLTSHDVVSHTKAKIKTLLLRRQSAEFAASPATSSKNGIPMSVRVPWISADVARFRCVLECFKEPDERLMIAASYLMFGKPERGFFDQASRVHLLRGDLRDARAGQSSGISAVAHTRHCLDGPTQPYNNLERIEVLKLEFVEIRYFTDSTHPEAFTSIWEIRPKPVG